MDSNSLPTVLVFTYPEYGQANVNLATSYELALSGANVHIASFAPLRDRVSHLQGLVNRHASGNHSGSVTFHECKGITPFWEALRKHGLDDTTFMHPPGVLGALESYSMLIFVACPWDKDEYLAGIESLKGIISIVKPNIVVTDLMFYLARDACRLLDQKFMVISPNSIQDLAVNSQPYAAALWKYPVLSSGFPYPLNWWQIPINVYLSIRLGQSFTSSERLKNFQELRRSFGLGPMVLGKPSPGVRHVCPALVETELPLAVIPQEITLCGPIIMPFEPLEEKDPALTMWLDNGPTVMINLGSHVVFDERFSREMAGAIRILLDYHDRKQSGKMQVLWKARAHDDIRKVIDEIVGKEIEEGRVKILAWLEPEPISVLQHPNVVCTVHHGGANSFYEGIWSGMPHIVLPVWLDTYDYATRAEFLNVGLCGNKSSAPGVQAEELGQTLVRVTGDGEEAAKFRNTAQYLKELCRAKGNGRWLSAMAILKEATMSKGSPMIDVLH